MTLDHVQEIVAFARLIFLYVLVQQVTAPDFAVDIGNPLLGGTF